MARDNIHDNLDDIANNLDKRKAIFVDDTGHIHPVDEPSGQAPDENPQPGTQLKSTTWYR